MKITVFGASGGTGTEVVRQAVASGWQVTAVVRDPARLAVPERQGLEVVTADVLNPAEIEPAIAGRDAVISALGPRDRGPSIICRDGTRSIIEAMGGAAVRRLLVVSNSGMHTEGDGFFTGRIVKPILMRVLREGYADMRAMEELVFASGLEWTVLRPPRLVGRPARGKVASRTDGNVRRGFTLGRADLAGYLLGAAARRDLIRAAVSVAQG
jgi:uncharacterized protein YbjT (DUF2867 family)